MLKFDLVSVTASEDRQPLTFCAKLDETHALIYLRIAKFRVFQQSTHVLKSRSAYATATIGKPLESAVENNVLQLLWTIKQLSL